MWLSTASCRLKSLSALLWFFALAANTSCRVAVVPARVLHSASAQTLQVSLTLTSVYSQKCNIALSPEWMRKEQNVHYISLTYRCTLWKAEDMISQIYFSKKHKKINRNQIKKIIWAWLRSFLNYVFIFCDYHCNSPGWRRVLLMMKASFSSTQTFVCRAHQCADISGVEMHL